MTWRAASDQGRARVAANLEVDRLDLDRFEAFAHMMGRKSGDNKAGPALDTDISVRLKTDRLVYAGVFADKVRVATSLAGDDLQVEQFSAADLAGAEIEASGRIDKLSTAPDGSFRTSVKASRIDGLVTMLKGPFPENPLVDRLAAGGEALAPLSIDGSITAKADGEDNSQVCMALSGDLGGSKLDG
ncbi:hypothetical protein [Breoghania sp.]|uniref:hypothetical protein n=1 Tax=Breoghania sp. TaxID=2065378 RepID=UPI002604A0B3|nr:hypothetical protein [Breoghania sp.]MDJ0931178.1 hypothetical protein [Breoghania sp.]